MKRYIEPVLLLALEALLLLFSGIDYSLIYLLCGIGFLYFFVRGLMNQNEAVIQARQHRILAFNFRVNPFDTHTLQKGLEMEKSVKKNVLNHSHAMWLHLVLGLANIVAVILVITHVIPG